MKIRREKIHVVGGFLFMFFGSYAAFCKSLESQIAALGSQKRVTALLDTNTDCIKINAESEC
jgi:hypothetical protein